MSTPTRPRLTPSAPSAQRAPGAAVAGATPPSTSPETRSLSTPSGLRWLRTLTVLASLVAAVVAGIVFVGSARATTSIADGTQQLLRLQTIKGDILRADGLALNGLAQGSKESVTQQQEYRSALQGAAKLAVEASLAEPRDQGDIAQVNGALVAYAATLEMARTSVRADASDKGELVDEASTALRHGVVPVLDRLIAANNERINSARAESRLWAIPIAVVPVVVALITAVFAARRTHRVLNLGLVVSLLASLATWYLVNTGLAGAAHLVDAAREGSLRTATSAASAYVALSDAKSVEGSQLVAPAQSAQRQRAWQTSYDAAARSTSFVGTAKGPLTRQLAAYDTAHGALVSRVASLKASDLAKAAGDTGASSVNVTYRVAAGSLTTVARDARTQTERDMHAQATRLEMYSVLALLLGVVSAVAAALGVGMRLQEFR